MTTIAQDYAVELRRISSMLGMNGLIDDADELRLAAQYLEQAAKGCAIDFDGIEERLAFDRRRVERFTRFAELVIESQTRFFEREKSQAWNLPLLWKDFFDWIVVFYLQQAAIFAVTATRPEGMILSEQDFVATARDAWMRAVLEDATAQTKTARAQS
ncbi:hypothetical protein [Methylosinus sp. Sm6]|uniref:hypothetical protein n=1 Tax=Methylosinus sp. Sm6 TaxID=2866948 RepID=UPI001C9A204A|nr:hypothetical protein [Methylosinus sp. Sm6]MBY6243882.1 hypothetical protein [Methylosinus sp. Sm6]